jgi:2'-5' RNA ligase
MRSFIAAELPLDLRKKINIGSRFQAVCRCTAVKPENMHVTLFFFPDLSVEESFIVQSCMKAVPLADTEISLSGVSCFTKGGAPSVVYARAESEGLTVYREKLAGLLKGEGVHFDPKPFKIHVTLFRVKEVYDRAGFYERFDSLNTAVSPVKLNACGVSFYRSILHHTGPVYEPVWTAGLTA